MSAAEPIIIERRDGLAVITLNRPERRNALGSATMNALGDALHAFGDDPDCRAVVLTGAPPAFCAGSDLKELGGLTVGQMCAHEDETARIVRRFAHLPVPIIAAVEGYALGGGMALAACCDVIVTGRTTQWRMPEVANGWLPPWGLQALIARVGPVKAQLICWGVTAMDGDEAHRLGLADELADDGGALESASALAGSLAALPVEAARSVKRYFGAAIAADAERQDAEASRLFAENCRSGAAHRTLARFAVTA